MENKLNLVFYRVNSVEFDFNEKVKPNTTFQIKPKIECKAAKKDSNFIVTLTLKINEDISSPVPFDLKVALTGVFKINDMSAEQRLLVGEAFNVLFPYLRATVSAITVNCNIPAYVLPAVSPEQLTDNERIGDFIIKKPTNLN